MSSRIIIRDVPREFADEVIRPNRRASPFRFEDLEVNGNGVFVASDKEFFSQERGLSSAFARVRRMLGYRLVWQRSRVNDVVGFYIWREPGVATFKTQRNRGRADVEAKAG